MVVTVKGTAVILLFNKRYICNLCLLGIGVSIVAVCVENSPQLTNYFDIV
jgi:hypothetical protein